MSALEARAASGEPLEVFTGHGYRFTGLAARCAELGAHRRARSRDVASALDELVRPSVWRVAEAMPWRGDLRSMRGFPLGSALAQTMWHVDALHRSAELRDSA